MANMKSGNTSAGWVENCCRQHRTCLRQARQLPFGQERRMRIVCGAVSFVLIHTIFKPLLNLPGAQFPQQEHIESAVQCHRNLTRTVEKQHTPHQERMFPSSKKSKFTLAETCPRQQNTLLEEEEKNGLPFVWKQKRQTRRKMSCRKKHGRAG